MRGAQLQPFNTNTPHPALKMDKMFRTSGPYSVPIWLRRRQTIFFSYLEGTILLVPQVCVLKMLRISWGTQICMQNMKNLSDPPTSPIQPHKPGCWDRTPRGWETFPQNPHISVFKMIRARGAHVKVCMLGYPGPCPLPPPPRTLSNAFRGNAL